MISFIRKESFTPVDAETASVSWIQIIITLRVSNKCVYVCSEQRLGASIQPAFNHGSCMEAGLYCPLCVCVCVCRCSAAEKQHQPQILQISTPPSPSSSVLFVKFFIPQKKTSSQRQQQSLPKKAPADIFCIASLQPCSLSLQYLLDEHHPHCCRHISYFQKSSLQFDNFRC